MNKKQTANTTNSGCHGIFDFHTCHIILLTMSSFHQKIMENTKTKKAHIQGKKKQSMKMVPEELQKLNLKTGLPKQRRN